MMGDVRDLVDRSIERILVCFRRFSEAAQLSNKLKRRRADLVVRRRRGKIMQGLNVSAHEESLTADAVVSKVESITRMKTDFLPTLNFQLFSNSTSAVADCGLQFSVQLAIMKCVARLFRF
jgi:hypothetical protein